MRDMIPTLMEAKRDFVEWRYSQGYSPKTVENDTSAIKHLATVVGWNRPVSDIHGGHIQEVLDARKISPSTANLRRAVFSKFFKYCRSMKMVNPDFDPLINTRKRPQPKKERRRVHPSDVNTLINGSESQIERIILALGMNLLLRISEVLDLRVGDVDLSSKRVNVRIFKTGDVDSMPMMFELEQELRRHLIWLTTQVGELKPDYHLVPGTNGHGKFVPSKPARRPADIIKKGLTRIGWEDVRGEGGHTLRRTGARLLLMRLEDKGIDRAMRIVQYLLHHKNMAQTEHYLGITVDRQYRDRVLTGMRFYSEDENVIPLRKAE